MLAVVLMGRFMRCPGSAAREGCMWISRGFALALVCLCLGARAEVGVTDQEVVVGQFAPFSGPAEQLGKRLNVGIQAYLQSVNAQGGIHGRRLRLVTRDDGYEPDRAVAAAKGLIEQDNVFALVGSVGTPTAWQQCLCSPRPRCRW